MCKIVSIAHINSRPLSEFQSDPRVRAWNALDDHFGPLSEEIEVETYADVLDARQRIDAPPTTVWRFVRGYDRGDRRWSNVSILKRSDDRGNNLLCYKCSTATLTRGTIPPSRI